MFGGGHLSVLFLLMSWQVSTVLSILPRELSGRADRVITWWGDNPTQQLQETSPDNTTEMPGQPGHRVTWPPLRVQSVPCWPARWGESEETHCVWSTWAGSESGSLSLIFATADTLQHSQHSLVTLHVSRIKHQTMMILALHAVCVSLLYYRTERCRVQGRHNYYI